MLCLQDSCVPCVMRLVGLGRRDEAASCGDHGNTSLPDSSC